MKQLRRHLGSLQRQVRGFPSQDATGNFTDGIKSAALQQAGGDGRAVASGAIREQRTVSWNSFDFCHQMIERDGQTSCDVFLIALTRRADVNRKRRKARRQELGSE